MTTKKTTVRGAHHVLCRFAASGTILIRKAGIDYLKIIIPEVKFARSSPIQLFRFPGNGV